MRLSGQRNAPAALAPAKTRYPLYRRLGGPQGQSGQKLCETVQKQNNTEFIFHNLIAETTFRFLPQVSALFPAIIMHYV
jgi:hypothetical protein